MFLYQSNAIVLTRLRPSGRTPVVIVLFTSVSVHLDTPSGLAEVRFALIIVPPPGARSSRPPPGSRSGHIQFVIHHRGMTGHAVPDTGEVRSIGDLIVR
jgi:hypothetical protein